MLVVVVLHTGFKKRLLVYYLPTLSKEGNKLIVFIEDKGFNNLKIPPPPILVKPPLKYKNLTGFLKKIIILINQ